MANWYKKAFLNILAIADISAFADIRKDTQTYRHTDERYQVHYLPVSLSYAVDNKLFLECNVLLIYQDIHLLKGYVKWHMMKANRVTHRFSDMWRCQINLIVWLKYIMYIIICIQILTVESTRYTGLSGTRVKIKENEKRRKNFIRQKQFA